MEKTTHLCQLCAITLKNPRLKKHLTFLKFLLETRIETKCKVCKLVYNTFDSWKHVETWECFIRKKKLWKMYCFVEQEKTPTNLKTQIVKIRTVTKNMLSIWFPILLRQKRFKKTMHFQNLVETWCPGRKLFKKLEFTKKNKKQKHHEDRKKAFSITNKSLFHYHFQ